MEKSLVKWVPGLLYLVHASISKQQCGVLMGDGGGAVTIFMFLLLEEVDEHVTNLVATQTGVHLGLQESK